MEQRRKVILITDGDKYAKKAVQYVAREVGGRCISMSQGNPSHLSGQELIRLIHKAKSDPVLVMFDDSGYLGEGAGERAMRIVATDPSIELLGIIAVASKTRSAEWTKVDVSIDRYGNLTSKGVDKYGMEEMEIGKIMGDTVYCIDELDAPIVVGIGDIGKMAQVDDYRKGSPVTKLAVEIILERSKYRDERKRTEQDADT
jgi:stage V sporulation protein AE